MFFFGNIYKQFMTSLKLVGFKRTLDVIASRLADYIFDLRFGIDTVECIELENLQIQRENKERGQRYQPTGILPFKKLMRILNLPPGCVLVDFGSGKGRVLLMAAQYNVKKVVGIEFSTELCKIAMANIEKFRQKVNVAPQIDLMEGDVSEYIFKDDENVFYFFHPFDKLIMGKVIENIANSLVRKPRQAWLVYYLPVHREIIEKQRSVFRKKEEYILSGYDCVVYATGNTNV